jgi:putative membrane protein
MTMTRLHWHAVSALALCALNLSACQKSSQDTLSVTSSESTDASSVTPGDGTPTLAASSADSAMADAAPGTDASTYLAKAGAGDLFEIDSSRAVLKTTQDPQVKSFAQMMIKDHEASTAMLKKAARGADINVPAPRLTTDQQQSLDAIKAATGKDADKIYLDAQRQGHAAALALHKSYAANGNSQPLKAAAAQIVPVVEHHAAMLDKMGG